MEKGKGNLYSRFIHPVHPVRKKIFKDQLIKRKIEKILQ